MEYFPIREKTAELVKCSVVDAFEDFVSDSDL